MPLPLPLPMSGTSWNPQRVIYERVHEALRREGANTLDVSCNELSGALIERYLSVKRTGRL